MVRMNLWPFAEVGEGLSRSNAYSFPWVSGNRGFSALDGVETSVILCAWRALPDHLSDSFSIQANRPCVLLDLLFYYVPGDLR